MRDLKFRAWNKENKKMYIPECIVDGKAGEVIYGEIISISSEDTVMQYTGLKDMNGVGVFQGDILNLYNVFKTPMRMGVVKYDIARASNVIYYKESNCGFDINAFEHIEVVGNIFENPDMMNEAHTN
ncbi:MAG: YopX family protein [Bacilli bacterium]|jgi:uncharacterized phage protein (TIGR01671 family)